MPRFCDMCDPNSIFYSGSAGVYAVGYLLWAFCELPREPVEAGSTDGLPLRLGLMIVRQLLFGFVVAAFVPMVCTLAREQLRPILRHVYLVAGILHLVQQSLSCVYVKRFNAETMAAMVLTSSASGMFIILWTVWFFCTFIRNRRPADPARPRALDFSTVSYVPVRSSYTSSGTNATEQRERTDRIRNPNMGDVGLIQPGRPIRRYDGYDPYAHPNSRETYLPFIPDRRSSWSNILDTSDENGSSSGSQEESIHNQTSGGPFPEVFRMSL